ncbi:PAS domain-containing protein [Sphingomonas sp. LaA6.9]|uniref:PAS domain-containing protein n=1 Tax=Sphingomonas sp. LaA6.9 TaxID=2919914 RepID=UPI001F4F27CE|nr:PAS domain-containing protein [Sphingomonas sp. LaA6.9]MCJ8155852.1 PAS domain-containing protein [Sphingomonas sp. LaA6.9]
MTAILDEQKRAQLLADYAVLDSTPESDFDAIVEFAASLCDAPIALISFVGSDHQWYKARHGTDICETPRETSFCALAMLGHATMIVPDASRDPRFATNPLVIGPPGIRFYAGAPLVSPEGVPLGSLCVIDTEPRDGLTPLQRQGLDVLAAQVMALLEARRRLRLIEEHDRLLTESEHKFRILADTMPQMMWSALPDGHADYFNARWYEFTGVAKGDSDGERWESVLHPDDRPRTWAAWRHSLATGETYEIEYRIRHHSGEYRWALGRALPMRDAEGRVTRWFGTCTDIHETRLAAEQRELVAHELSHRIKNIFAVIAGLINLSARTRPEMRDMAEDLRTRVLALGRAHDFVRPRSHAAQQGVDNSRLQGLLTELFVPYNDAGQPRVRVTGADPAIDDRSATPLALLFHELATNASKYGSLSVATGSVEVIIELEGHDCVILWREHGGPSVDHIPEFTGFGSRLIALSIGAQLHGSIDKHWTPGGLSACIRIPMESLARR